nr:unnamed protein product [Spirometra erinaceieuropaei]
MIISSMYCYFERRWPNFMKSSTSPVRPFRVSAVAPSTTANHGSNIFGSSILRPSVLSGKVTTTVDNFSSKPPPPVSKAQSPPATKPSLPPPVFPSTAPPISVAPSNSEYIFGQNMLSRVVNAAQSSSSSSTLWQTASSASETPADKETESPNPQIQSSSVFTVLAKAVASNNSTTAAAIASNHPVELKESASELARKRNLAQIKLIEAPSMTGEEGERIVLQLSCSAYVFNTESRQWTSLGQSYLHLNDELSDDRKSVTSSRFILRLQSTRRVLVNTRIWPEMPLSTAEAKGVRLGALDVDGTSIRTYLLRFPAAQNASRLYEALLSRKQESASTQIKRQRLSGDPGDAPPHLPSSTAPTTATTKLAGEVAITVGAQRNETIPTRSQSPNPDPKTVQASPGKSLINGTPSAGSSIPVLNLKCLALVCDDPGSSTVSACVSITDYANGNQSVFEIRPSTDSADTSAASLLTVTVGFRLAFCFSDERSLRLFVTAPTTTASDLSAAAGNAEGPLEQSSLPRVNSFVVRLDTRQEAERLFRCLLLRINRLFMENQSALPSAITSANSSNVVRESMTDSSACQDENCNSVSLG